MPAAHRGWAPRAEAHLKAWALVKATIADTQPMPTLFTHPAVPLAIGIALSQRIISKRLLLAGVVASIAPDFDGIGFKLGVSYASDLGHRGFTHSIAFALLLGVIAALCFRTLHERHRWIAFAFVFVAALSHPLLDMFTNGGLGVALYWPFSSERVFFDTRFIEVSPISVSRFLSERGLAVLRSEFVGVWLPLAIIALGGYTFRRYSAKR
jgi:inner membrane protein